jgi:hypothetical protein
MINIIDYMTRKTGAAHSTRFTDLLNLQLGIQGVFEVEAFLLTCDNMRCSKEL